MAAGFRITKLSWKLECLGKLAGESATAGSLYETSGNSPRMLFFFFSSFQKVVFFFYLECVVLHAPAPAVWSR